MLYSFKHKDHFFQKNINCCPFQFATFLGLPRNTRLLVEGSHLLQTWNDFTLQTIAATLVAFGVLKKNLSAVKMHLFEKGLQLILLFCLGLLWKLKILWLVLFYPLISTQRGFLLFEFYEDFIQMRHIGSDDGIKTGQQHPLVSDCMRAVISWTLIRSSSCCLVQVFTHKYTATL